MPTVSKAQHNLMEGVAHNPAFARKVGIPQRVGREFADADAHDAAGAKIAAGTVYVDPEGKILLLKRSEKEKNYAGHWALPGGGGEPGESPEDTAEREAAEELGNTAPAGRRKLLDKRQTPNGMIFHTFAQPVDEAFSPRLNEEHTHFGWFPLHALPGDGNDLAPEPMHPAVKSTIENQLGTAFAADMEPSDWDDLRKNFVKWTREEEAEPEHQAVEDPALAGAKDNQAPLSTAANTGIPLAAAAAKKPKKKDLAQDAVCRGCGGSGCVKCGGSGVAPKTKAPMKPGLGAMDSLRAICRAWSGARDAEFNEADHPRADNGQFGSGGGSGSKTSEPAKFGRGNGGPAAEQSHPVGSTAAFHEMVTKHKIPEAAKAVAGAARNLKEKHKRIAAFSKHIETIYAKADKIISINAPDEIIALNDLAAAESPEEINDYAKDIAKTKVGNIDSITADLSDYDFEPGQLEELHMLQSRLESLYPKAVQAAKDVRGAALETTKAMKDMRKRIDKSPMYDEMETEDTETLYATKMAEIADDDPESLDDLIDETSYLADEPVSPEHAEHLQGKMEDLAEESAERRRWDALSEEEQESELETQRQSEKEEDAKHTKLVNSKVDAALERGWRPEFNSVGGWKRPPELEEFASPKSAHKIYDRMEAKGIKLPETVKERMSGLGQDALSPLIARLMAQDSRKEPDHTLTVRYDGDFSFKGLLAHLQRLGAIGASRTIEARDEEDKIVPFGWDGDGADKIWDAEIDGEQLACDRAMIRGVTRHGVAFDRKPDSVRSIDDDGRLHVEVSNISRAAVNPYMGREIPGYKVLGLDPDKIYQLFRDPEELRKAVPTFNNIPLLDEHVGVNAADHKPEHVIGSTGTDAEFDGEYMKNSLVVWAQRGIKAIESNKKRELSAAYRYTPVMESGVYKGMPYSIRMTKISANHIATVQEGRAGSSVVVGDSAISDWDRIEAAILGF